MSSEHARPPKPTGLAVLLTLTGLLGSVGCNNGPAMGQVHGTVSLDGEPVSEVLVVFQPRPADGGAIAATKRAVGRTDEQGQYTLSTIEVNDGAAVGQHLVTIEALDQYARPPGRLPNGHTVEVAAGDNTFDFELE